MLKWFSSPKLTVGLMVSLGMMVMAFYATTWLSAQTEMADAEVIPSDFNIAYLTAENMRLVEPDLQLANLQEAASHLQSDGAWQMEVVHSWDDALKSDNLQAIVVHHSAATAVDWSHAAELFQTKGLVVAGLGIPGRDLANWLKMPSIYNGREGSGTATTPYYFYIYSMYIGGDQKEVATYREELNTGRANLFDDGLSYVASSPLSIFRKFTTDSLHPEYWPDGSITFMNALHNHLLDVEGHIKEDK